MLLEKAHTPLGGTGKKSKAQTDGSEKGRRAGKTLWAKGSASAKHRGKEEQDLF